MWDDGAIWQGARQGRLLLKACRACGEICHPPLPICPHCQSTEMELRQASGEARLHSWLVSIRPEGTDGDSQVTIVAELAEGARFVSNLVGGDLPSLHEGMPLELCFAEVDGKALPLFRPAR
jgi:uncharacterized OB-fold protein